MINVDDPNLISLITEGKLLWEWEPDGQTPPPSREAFLAWADSVGQFWLDNCGPYVRAAAVPGTEWRIECFKESGELESWSAHDDEWSAEAPW